MAGCGWMVGNPLLETALAVIQPPSIDERVSWKLDFPKGFDQIQAALPELLERFLAEVALVGVQLAGETASEVGQHGAIGSVAI